MASKTLGVLARDPHLASLLPSAFHIFHRTASLMLFHMFSCVIALRGPHPQTLWCDEC